MVLHKVLMEMLGREPAVAAPIKGFHLRLASLRDALVRHPAKSPIQQTGLAVLLMPLAPATERPLPDPQQRRRLQLPKLRSLVPAHLSRNLIIRTP